MGIGANTDIMSEGRRNQAIVNRVAVLEAGAAATSAVTLTLPEPHEPFTVAYRPTPQGCVANLPIDIPNTTDRLVIVVIAHNDRDTQAHFENRRLENAYQITDDQRSAQTGNFDFGFLKYNTLYDLLKLKAINGDGGRLVNPPDDAAIGDVALETFTTPPAYGSPSAPHIGNILENKMDDVTAAFDAFITVQIIAPYLSTSTTTGISINGTTTVTKTTPFVGVSAGMGFTVNGETHIVASVGSTTLTTDFAFSQTLSAQTATFGTLQTWGSIKSVPTQETGLPATRVIAKFQLTDDSNNRAVSKSYVFSTAESAQTSIIMRVDGFIAARKYNWVSNAIVEPVGNEVQRIVIPPLTPQTFIAGDFIAGTSGLTNLSSPTWHYDLTDRDNFRNTTFSITQSTPKATALDNFTLERRHAGTGTVTISGTAVTGSGTAFLTELAKGNILSIGTLGAVGAQRLRVTNVASDTSATVDTSVTVSSPSAFKIGHRWPENYIRRRKFNTPAVVCRFDLGPIKVKKLVSQDFVVTITSADGFQREDIDNFTAGADGPVPTDTAVPSGLGTPNLQFIAKVGVHIDGMTVSTAWNTGLEKAIVLYDGSTTYFDLPTYMSSGAVTVQAAASEAAARYSIGSGKEHATLGVRLKDLKTILVGGTMKGYFYATNTIGTSSKSTDSAGITLSGAKDIVSGRDAVNVVDVGVTLDTKVQQALNGDFLFNNGTAHHTNGWTKGTAASSTDIINTTTDDIFWDEDNHRLKWINKASSAVHNFKKRLVKGDFYAVSVQAQTAGSFGSGMVQAQFVNADDSSATAGGTGFDLIPLASLSSSYLFFGVILQLDTTSDYTANKFLKLTTAATLTSTNNVIIDKIMVNRGKAFAAFSSRMVNFEGDATAPGNTENINLTTINNVTFVDIGNPVGSQGGGYVPGAGGGLISPSTL